MFHERDLYTIKRADGQRDLVLEHGLSGLESEFAAIRDSRLTKRRPITAHDHLMLCAFIAASSARTPAQRDHLTRQWTEVLEKMERMKERAEAMTPGDRRRAFPDIGGRRGPRLGYEDVKRLVESPMETMLVPQISTETPLLMRLDCAVLCSAGSSFITSDNPCVWSDPEAYKRPPFYQAPALIYDSVEISLPASPRQLIVLNRRGVSGYFPASERAVDEHNRRTRFGCTEYFVADSNATKALWFDPGVEPGDSWRKLHSQEETEKPRGPWQ